MGNIFPPPHQEQFGHIRMQMSDEQIEKRESNNKNNQGRELEKKGRFKVKNLNSPSGSETSRRNSPPVDPPRVGVFVKHNTLGAPNNNAVNHKDVGNNTSRNRVDRRKSAFENKVYVCIYIYIYICVCVDRGNGENATRREEIV